MLGKKINPEKEFFTNQKGENENNKRCLRCENDCKQSYRASAKDCNKYKRR